MRSLMAGILVLACIVGCEEGASGPGTAAKRPTGPPPPPPPINQQTGQQPPVVSPVQPVVPTTEDQSEMERVKARAGVAKPGRSLDDPKMNRLIVGPARAYFTARERIMFEIQVPSALNTYKALNGAAPKTHEEFMEKVIKANRINLPELPPGSRYVYSPEDEDLMVERPR